MSQLGIKKRQFAERNYKGNATEVARLFERYGVEEGVLKLGSLEHTPSFSVNSPANSNSADYIRQEIAISLPYETFLRIAQGKKVQIRMGPREFKLGENHLEALRDLASRTVP
jgi:hypothetical protein